MQGSVKIDKASGIVRSASHNATKVAGDPAYTLKLIQRAITVSLETLDIESGLLRLVIHIY